MKCGEISVFPECPCLTPDRYHFSRIASYGYYEDGIKDIIAAYKYEKKKDLAKPLGIILALYINDELLWKNTDCIVPIPIYGDVLQKRGFNQSLLLAEVIGNELEISVQSNILAKICCTKDQSTLSREERIKNVKGAFAAGSECKGKNILLVDDVFTTGATVNEASRVLKEIGALSVSILTLAKTIFHSSSQNNTAIKHEI